VSINWAGEHRFDAARASGGPAIRVDADAATGPGPVDTLLIALGTCTAVDVVDILAKRRTPVESMSIEVVGTRHEGGFAPRRIVHARLVYKIRGQGIERVHAERAIDLAVTKYCSVRDSLDPKIPVEWALELNGDGDAIADGPVP
jgi:putative redox protein